MIKSVEACAQRYHDPSPDSMRRVAFAPTTPPWSLAPDEPRVIAAARAPHGPAHPRPSVGDHGRRRVLPGRLWQAAGRHGWPINDYLGRDVWLAHLVHVDDDEIRLLAETGTGMAHCPQSNCRLGSGIAPAEKTCGAGRRRLACRRRRGLERVRRHDQRDEQRLAHHRAAKGAAALSIEDVVRWGSANGARVLGFRGCRRHRARQARGSSPSSSSRIPAISACTTRCSAPVRGRRRRASAPSPRRRPHGRRRRSDPRARSRAASP